MKRIITYSALFLTLTSCTSNIYFKVLEPARSPLPSHIKNILIGVVYEDSPTIEKKIATTKLLYHLRGNLSSTPRYNVINDEINFPILNKDLRLDDSTNIKSILRSNNADAIILLTKTIEDSRLSQNENFETFEDDFGNITTSRSYIYSAIIRLSTNFLVTDGNPYTDISNFKSSHIEQIQSYNQITNQELSDAYNVLAYKLVEDFNSKINLKWKEISREYYGSGNEKLIEASNLVKFDKIDEAILIWKELTKEDGNKIKGRACFNMAVASEIKGSYTMAFDWLKRAKRFGCKKALEYEKTLNKQYESAKKLNTQFSN